MRACSHARSRPQPAHVQPRLTHLQCHRDALVLPQAQLLEAHQSARVADSPPRGVPPQRRYQLRQPLRLQPPLNRHRRQRKELMVKVRAACAPWGPGPTRDIHAPLRQTKQELQTRFGVRGATFALSRVCVCDLPLRLGRDGTLGVIFRGICEEARASRRAGLDGTALSCF